MVIIRDRMTLLPTENSLFLRLLAAWRNCFRVRVRHWHLPWRWTMHAPILLLLLEWLVERLSAFWLVTDLDRFSENDVQAVARYRADLNVKEEREVHFLDVDGNGNVCELKPRYGAPSDSVQDIDQFVSSWSFTFRQWKWHLWVVQWLYEMVSNYVGCVQQLTGACPTRWRGELT